MRDWWASLFQCGIIEITRAPKRHSGLFVCCVSFHYSIRIFIYYNPKKQGNCFTYRLSSLSHTYRVKIIYVGRPRWSGCIQKPKIWITVLPVRLSKFQHKQWLSVFWELEWRKGGGLWLCGEDGRVRLGRPRALDNWTFSEKQKKWLRIGREAGHSLCTICGDRNANLARHTFAIFLTQEPQNTISVWVYDIYALMYTQRQTQYIVLGSSYTPPVADSP